MTTTQNLFASAKTVPAKKTKGKRAEETVEIPGLRAYAEAVALEKAIKALKETLRGDIEAHVMDEFVSRGVTHRSRPDNFKGSDEGAIASCELRRRSSASGLSDAELGVLDQYGVSTEEEVLVEDTFIINPDYAGDGELLGRVSEALVGVEGIPEDFIMRQQGRSKRIVIDESIDQVFQLPVNAVRNLLPIVTVTGLKPVLKGIDVAEAIDNLRSVLTDLGGEE